MHELDEGNLEIYPNGFTKEQIFYAVSPNVMSLTLLPTEKCNFRCTYCYEDFEIGRMSENTQHAIELLITSRIQTLKFLNFSWFGGEPLLAKDIVLRIARHGFNLANEHGVNFHGGLTTNAYLLSLDLAEELISLRQNFFQITLDGYGDEHDRLRRRADGKGTFNQIWSNLKQMRNINSYFDCSIRVHVRRDNIANLEVLMREIAKELGADRRYRIDFQHLRNMGGEGGKTIVSPLSLSELGQAKAHLSAIYRDAVCQIISGNHIDGTDLTHSEKFHFSTPVEGLASIQTSSESEGSRRKEEVNGSAPYICYAAKPNNLMIRANGRIGKCTVALDDDRNDLGYLDDDGRIIMNQQKHSSWFRGLETLNVDTVSCPIKGMSDLGIASPIREQKIAFINR